MKNIFIATDFSPAANNAAVYAVALAQQYHATVHLFHAYESNNDVALVTNPSHPFHELKEWLIAQAELINKDGKTKLQMSVEEGPATETIIKNAREKEADLIICAMKDNARGFKRIFGSVTLSLINKSNIPLLVIPESVSFKKPGHVALAIDMDPNTSPVTLDVMQDMCEQFFSKLSVLYVLNENYNENEVMKFHAPANLSNVKHLRPQYEFRTGDDIARTLDLFANKNAVDMLAIIPHKHSLMERWLTESVTKRIVYQTHLPVLILPQKIAGIDDLQTNNSKEHDYRNEIKEKHQ